MIEALGLVTLLLLVPGMAFAANVQHHGNTGSIGIEGYLIHPMMIARTPAMITDSWNTDSSAMDVTIAGVTNDTHVVASQTTTCVPPINGSCSVFNGKTTYMLNNETVCDDGSHAGNNGMCHYPICPDGSTPVGRGTCVGPEIGECIHAADGNGNCRDIMYCGGPATVSGGVTSCPDRAPTNTSLTLPPLRCDQPGYVFCYKFGFGAGWFDPTLNYCPISGYANHGNATQDAHYCLGFTAGQIQEPIDQAKLAKSPSPACPTHTPSCCVGKNGEIIGNATDRRCA